MHPDSPAAKSQSQQINPPGPPDSVICIVLSCCSFSHSTTTSLAPPHSVICVAQLSSSSSRPIPPQIGDMYRPDSLLAVTGDRTQRGRTFPPLTWCFTMPCLAAGSCRKAGPRGAEILSRFLSTARCETRVRQARGGEGQEGEEGENAGAGQRLQEAGGAGRQDTRERGRGGEGGIKERAAGEGREGLEGEQWGKGNCGKLFRGR